MIEIAARHMLCILAKEPCYATVKLHVLVPTLFLQTSSVCVVPAPPRTAKFHHHISSAYLLIISGAYYIDT